MFEQEAGHGTHASGAGSAGYADKRNSRNQPSHAVLAEFSVHPMSQLLHIEAPFDVHSLPVFATPLSQLQLFAAQHSR